jgi:hypothetical protein
MKAERNAHGSVHTIGLSQRPEERVWGVVEDSDG